MLTQNIGIGENLVALGVSLGHSTFILKLDLQ